MDCCSGVPPLSPALLVCHESEGEGGQICLKTGILLSKLDETGPWNLIHERDQKFYTIINLHGEIQWGDLIEHELLNRFPFQSTAQLTFLCEMMRRGRMIFSTSHEPWWADDLMPGFRVCLHRNRTAPSNASMMALGNAPVIPLRTNESASSAPSHSRFGYHLMLNPDQISPELSARLLADSVLEWWEDMHAQSSANSSPPHPLRTWKF